MVELEALNEITPQLREKGANLVVISPQLPSHSKKLIEEHGLQFEILHDKNLSLSDTLRLSFTFSDELSEVYKSFGLDVAAANGADEWRLPMPARYILDQDGLILDAEVNPDYAKRPEPSELLSLLETL